MDNTYWMVKHELYVVRMKFLEISRLDFKVVPQLVGT